MHPQAHWIALALTLGTLAFPPIAGLEPRAEISALQDSKFDPASELQALERRYEDAERKLREQFDRAKTDEERETLMVGAPWARFLDEFQALAEKSAGSDAAVGAWVWCMQLAESANKPQFAVRALDALESDYLESPALARAVFAIPKSAWMIGANRCEVFLRTACIESPHHGIQGAAIFTLAEMLIAPDATGVAEPKASGELAARKREGRALLARVIQDFADTPAPIAGAPKDWVRRRAEGSLFELDHLQIGMLAPDFEAVDQDGVKWKLSDYRGKVTALVFWGLWCVPCRAMLPHEKQLVVELASEPFALLGIDSDGANVKPRLVENGVTWRQAVDGDPSGPIATRWNVRAWPAVYVLDAKGVIRFRGLRGDELTKAVRQLLAE